MIAKRHLLPVLRSVAAPALCLLALCGCAVQKHVTSAEPTAFQTSTGISASGKIARLPFDHSWREPAINPADYSHLVIQPVSLRYLRKDQWEASKGALVSTQRVYLRYADELAHHWDRSLRRAFASPGNRFATTGDASQPGTLILEIAITEIVFSHPGMNAAAMAVPYGGVAASAMLSPTVAFEARVTDSATGRIVATASDRRGTRYKIVDLNSFTVSKANQEICDEWSQQIMEAFNKELFPQVKRKWFTPF